MGVRLRRVTCCVALCVVVVAVVAVAVIGVSFACASWFSHADMPYAECLLAPI